MKQPIVKIIKIRTIYGVSSLAEAFPKELRLLELEDILEPNVSMDLIMQKLQQFFPHSIMTKQESGGHKSYMFMEMELSLSKSILMRGNKLLGTGSDTDMQALLLEKIQGEYPGKFEKIHREEIDSDWIKQFCIIHYNDENKFRIINT